jgi:hypothetical protein
MADHVDGVTQEEVEELTEQFYVTLRAEVARLSPQDEARSPKSFKQIQDLLNGRRSLWSDAYQIEQLMVDLFDDRTLEIELQSRLLEGESNLRGPLITQYNKLASTLKAPADRRALLARLVNDLQWRYTVNEVKRANSKAITKTTGVIFMVAIALFAAMVVAFAILRSFMPTKFDLAKDSILLLIAALAGGWGAAFSMLSSVKGRLESADLNDLKLMKSRWILWSRPLIGVGAAAILYFFMASGLLGGTAFTVFPQTDSAQTAPQNSAAAPNAPTSGSEPMNTAQRTQLSLLIVWCFLAGFSERLVPSLLAKTEESAGSGAAASDRFKPGPVMSDSDAAPKPAATLGSSAPQTSPSPAPARAADAPSNAAAT